MRNTHSDIRISVSGWTYKPWRGNFYPEGLRQADGLAYAATQFNSIEVNGTHYSLQRPSSFAGWHAATPDDFVFAIKGSRYITHMRQLRDIETPVANFFASGLLRLGAKLGPILWQFPERFRYDRPRLKAFLALLPRTGVEAAALAKKHDDRVKGRAFLQPDGVGEIRHAVEIRSETFRDPDFIALLREQDIALVCADTVSWPLLMDLTADFVYCRLHGNTELYNSRYRPEELDRWAARIKAWRAGDPMRDGAFVTAPDTRHRPRDVYVYFDNTDKLHAPDDARRLMRLVGAD